MCLLPWGSASINLKYVDKCLVRKYDILISCYFPYDFRMVVDKFLRHFLPSFNILWNICWWIPKYEIMTILTCFQCFQKSPSQSTKNYVWKYLIPVNKRGSQSIIPDSVSSAEWDSSVVSKRFLYTWYSLLSCLDVLMCATPITTVLVFIVGIGWCDLLPGQGTC